MTEIREIENQYEKEDLCNNKNFDKINALSVQIDE